MKKNGLVLLLFILSLSVFGQEFNLIDLKHQFKNPPASAKPKTWMHVMSDNMSKEGLTKDLEAMADAGIGGIILFNVSHFIPKGKVKFNSPEHIEMTAHAAAECERLGLSFGIHNCDGWTSSGGPWVTPENSMKQIVNSEVIVKGGKVNIKLPTPSARGGYFKDVAVVAYPSLKSEISDWENKPKVTSSNPDFDTKLVTDGKIDARSELIVSKDKKAWIQFDFGKPYTVRSFYLNSEKVRSTGKTTLQSSDDGIHFKEVQELNVLRQGKTEYAIDKHFDGITARYFRFVTDMNFKVSEINLSAIYRFNDMLARTNLYKEENNRMPKIDEVPVDMVIKKQDILDLTKFMDKNGQLNTQLPKGNWTIMRFGYTITGAVNSPSSEDGRGWEVDKMSRESFKTFYEGYVRNVIDASKKVAPKALQYVEIDSYEVGGQNWTKNYETYFRKQLGYDILDFLPLYAGRYIDDAKTTDRVLWDMRNFNSKLMTDNYFDYFTELCHQDGLISYVEPYSFNAGFNELDAAKNVDIPMGEFWMHQRNYQTETAVSSARIYGKNIVSSEAFSADSDVNWKGHPGTLKLTGDKAWTLGINEFFFHRYAHQANTHVKPGMTMSQFGSHIDRTQTWWDNAGKSWFQYLARGQFMLRQGIPVSDLLFFVGDGSPNSIVKRKFSGNLPNYINYDCINADALINRVTVKNGKLVFPDGQRYHALYLHNTKEMHLFTLKKLAQIAEQGGIIFGDKPTELGGYNSTAADRTEFDKLVTFVWNQPTTYTNIGFDELFAKNNLPIDLMIKEGADINYIHRKTANEDIYFFYNPDTKERTYECTFNVKGKIPEFWNQMTGEITKLGTFEEVDGKTKVAITLGAENSGFIVFRESSKGVISVAIERVNPNIHFYLNSSNKIEAEINKNGIYNIAFSNGESRKIEVNNLPLPIEITNQWEVRFPDLKSKNKVFAFPNLMDWTKHENPEVKYYSGTAIYTTEFDINKNVLVSNKKYLLDLGQVNIAARVILNGNDLGVLWLAPYKLDITDALKSGKNKLSIEITNQWTNRLIGDENFPDVTGYKVKTEKMPEWYTNNEPAPLGERATFTTYPFYKKGDDLIPAGMVGPVSINTVIIKTID